MATIFQIPDHTTVAEPYEEVRANADNLNDPWRREYSLKHVKYGDLLNGMIGTLNSPVLRVRDDNVAGTVAGVSRVHNGAVDTSIRNATEIGSNGITEITGLGWDTPVFSRAVNEFSTPAAVSLQVQNAINGLADITGDVQLAILAWQDPQGPTVIKPAVDAWNDPVNVVNFTNFLQGQFGNPSPHNRAVSGTNGSFDRRDFVGSTAQVSQSGQVDPIIISSNVDRQLFTYNLFLPDSAIANPLTVDIFWETTSFTVYDDIQFSPVSNDTGTAVCPLIIFRFRPRNGGVVQEYEGGFSVRLFNVPFRQLSQGRSYFQLGSVVGNQNGINWFPKGS